MIVPDSDGDLIEIKAAKVLGKQGERGKGRGRERERKGNRES